MIRLPIEHKGLIGYFILKTEIRLPFLTERMNLLGSQSKT
jgi:hypothetical protein